ncbi:hypothetical protein ERO13_D01G153750v2 [Gossypium hirsutum]|nr:hypothetical protein ERO13_D01G153750v2 [Gossypium hirsutum]
MSSPIGLNPSYANGPACLGLSSPGPPSFSFNGPFILASSSFDCAKPADGMREIKLEKDNLFLKSLSFWKNPSDPTASFSPKKPPLNPPKSPPKTSSTINGENLDPKVFFPNFATPLTRESLWPPLISSRPTSTARNQLSFLYHLHRHYLRRMPLPHPQSSLKPDSPPPTGTTP